MESCLARSRTKGVRQAEVYHTHSRTKSVRLQQNRVFQKEGLTSSYHLRVLLHGMVGTAVGCEFSDALIDAAISNAFASPISFAKPQTYPVVSGIDDPSVDGLSIDEMTDVVRSLAEVSDVSVIEMAAEREQVEIANTFGVYGRYTHSLVKLAVSENARPPSTFYWRSKPTITELKKCFHKRLATKTETLAGTVNVIFIPSAAEVLLNDCFSDGISPTAGFPSCFNLTDDALRKGGTGARPFDDVGYACTTTPVVTAGKVVTVSPQGPGFYHADDAGRITTRWNHLIVQPSTTDITSSFTGLFIEHVERIGETWRIWGKRYEDGNAVAECLPEVIRESSLTLLARLTAVGNDPNLHSPSLRIDNVRIEPSPFAV